MERGIGKGKGFEKIIFPLDVPTKKDALRLVELLKDSVGVFKIGLELFVAVGPPIVEAVKKAAPNAKIFLDMKFHDIPATVARAMKSAASLGVDFITVHSDEGRSLLESAVSEASGVKVLAVTVLTSLSTESLKEMGFCDELQDPSKLVVHRARIAKEAGCAGIVCSGQEVSKVREEFGSSLITVTPGIRLAELHVKGDDQKRVVTPYDAVKNGADFIVVGRPIRDASDPVDTSKQIASDIERASLQ